jgi:hypothetical protein
MAALHRLTVLVVLSSTMRLALEVLLDALKLRIEFAQALLKRVAGSTVELL